MTRAAAPTWRHQEDALAGRVATAFRQAAQDLGVEPGTEAVGRLLGGDLSGAVAALTATAVRSAPGVDASRLQALLAELQAAGADIFDHELSLLSRRLEEVERALDQLRACADSDELLAQTCELLVTRCGFGRAVLSRVEGSLWTPWKGHFDGDESSWFGDWVDRPIPLDGLVVESRILRDRKPAAVYDTQAADVYRPIIVDAGHSSSYVVAPVIVSDEVIGFLHADYNPTGRRVDIVDRDVLWAFAEGFAQLYERAVLRERLIEQRELVRQALAASDALIADLTSTAALGSAFAAGGPAPRPLTGGPGVETLTERERQVLSMIAVGATNSQIGERLVVAESTVKTHVKHILRKLGVANRAQAVSAYLRA